MINGNGLDMKKMVEVISGSLKDKDNGSNKNGIKKPAVQSDAARVESIIEDETMDEVPPEPVV